ncbi:hypothetical protein Pmani_020845 [Petrolisthes manimaculis]|uniref:Protein kinase domain-containing protein n=1 Tax=Petrolisthes manimaculis TaxID=1843537 RepID=A0AAE1PHJ9_9EUCA|nr:hypothetical protein Pmani_020845 [Petrolisthes manimaculis]
MESMGVPIFEPEKLKHLFPQFKQGSAGKVFKVMYDNQLACLKIGHSLHQINDYPLEVGKMHCLDGAGGAPQLIAACSNIPLFVTTYCPGITIQDWVKNDTNPVTPMELLQVCLEVALRLKEIHVKGIIHNDINPNNIILDFQDKHYTRAHIIDFNLSTHYGSSLGLWNPNNRNHEKKYPWIAPEVYHGHTSCSSSDVFSLGYLFSYVTRTLIEQDRIPSHAPQIAFLEHLAGAMNTYFENRISISQVIDVLSSALYRKN